MTRQSWPHTRLGPIDGRIAPPPAIAQMVLFARGTAATGTRRWSALPRRLRAVLGALIAVVVIGVALGTIGVRGADITVNDQRDRVDADLGDLRCDVDLGVPADECTLRAAIQEANALDGRDTIAVPAGVFVLSLGAGGGEPVDPPDDRAGLDCDRRRRRQEGDLDITCPVTIIGAGPGETIVDGGDPPPAARRSSPPSTASSRSTRAPAPST